MTLNLITEYSGTLMKINETKLSVWLMMKNEDSKYKDIYVVILNSL